MRKEEYLQKLEKLLCNIPAEDRYEAMQFYSDYLEDAGTEAEEVLRALGTPEELADSIQKDLYGNNEAGDYTRTYKDLPGTYRFPTGGRFTGGQEAHGYSSSSQKTKESRHQTRKGKLTTGQWILFIILFFCAAPVIIPVFGGVLGIVLAIVIAVIAIVFGAGVAGVVLVIAAVVLLVAAIIKLLISPFSALIMMGGSLLMIGIGLIGVVFALWIVCKVLPKIFVFVVDILSGIVHRR